MSGCPGSRTIDFSEKTNQEGNDSGKRPSQLRQWPIQMHLVSPQAPYFQGKDVLLAADCTAFALGDFHKDYLKGKSIGIACPKLDSDQEVYVEKIKSLLKKLPVRSPLNRLLSAWKGISYPKNGFKSFFKPCRNKIKNSLEKG